MICERVHKTWTLRRGTLASVSPQTHADGELDDVYDVVVLLALLGVAE